MHVGAPARARARDPGGQAQQRLPPRRQPAARRCAPRAASTWRSRAPSRSTSRCRASRCARTSGGRAAPARRARPIVSLMKGVEKAHRPAHERGHRARCCGSTRVADRRASRARTSRSRSRRSSRRRPSSRRRASRPRRPWHPSRRNRYFRTFVNTDVIGTEFGGVLKNLIAVAIGIVDGVGYGENTKASIITRGLVEMTDFAVAYGAHPETLSGLAGLGDLIATCQSPLSRNNTAGRLLGQGYSFDDVVKQMQQTAEGLASVGADPRARRERRASRCPSSSRSAGARGHARPARTSRRTSRPTTSPQGERTHGWTSSTVVLLFGGRSSEHSISCATAGGVLRAIDRDRYERDPGRASPATARSCSRPTTPTRFALDAEHLPEVVDNGTRVRWPESARRASSASRDADGASDVARRRRRRVPDPARPATARTARSRACSSSSACPYVGVGRARLARSAWTSTSRRPCSQPPASPSRRGAP